MSETDTPAAPRLWTPQGFREDGWIRAGDISALKGNRRAILPLPVWLELDPQARAAAGGRLAVHLLPGDRLDAILPELGNLALVSLAFPAFNDGRSYSKATLLRSRHGYGGTIRAAGDVLIDQIPLMIRTGFDEFEVTNPATLKRLEENRPGGIAYRYQPASQAEDFCPRYSWRRAPASASLPPIPVEPASTS